MLTGLQCLINSIDHLKYKKPCIYLVKLYCKYFIDVCKLTFPNIEITSLRIRNESCHLN